MIQEVVKLTVWFHSQYTDQYTTNIPAPDLGPALRASRYPVAILLDVVPSADLRLSQFVSSLSKPPSRGDLLDPFGRVLFFLPSPKDDLYAGLLEFLLRFSTFDKRRCSANLLVAFLPFQ